MESKIVCRKCNGPHLTIKCGKEKENKIEKLIVTENKEETKEDKPKFFRKERTDEDDNKENKSFSKFEKRDTSDYKKRKFHKVKLNYLPTDVTEEEILEALYEDCGLKVSKIKVNNYNECSNAYIEFRTEDEVKYIVESLHKTPFEHTIIHAEQIFD